MSKITISSSFGIVVAKPLGLVDIHDIPDKCLNSDSELFEQNQDLEGSTGDGAQVIEAPAECSETEKSD